MISEPTRGEHTLDLFITNNESRIQKLKITPGMSEHDGIVYIETDIRPVTYKQKPPKMYLCKKADWDGLCNHMANFCDSFIEVSNCDPNLSVNQICDLFKSKLNSIISKFILTKVAKKRNGLPYVGTNYTPRRTLRCREIKHLVP